MTFRNPWIDPRVGDVKAADAQGYLVRRGWTALTDDDPNFHTFEAPDESDPPIVRVPLLEQGRDYPQRIIELITDIAVAEGRYAVAVLDDILHAGPPNNGKPVESVASSVSSLP